MRSLPNGILGRWRSVNLTTIWEMHADPWKMSGHDDLEMHGPGTFYKTALKTWNDPHLNFLVHNQMRASQQTTYLTCVSCGNTFTQVLLRKTRTWRNSTVHLNSKLTSLSQHFMSITIRGFNSDNDAFPACYVINEKIIGYYISRGSPFSRTFLDNGNAFDRV